YSLIIRVHTSEKSERAQNRLLISEIYLKITFTKSTLYMAIRKNLKKSCLKYLRSQKDAYICSPLFEKANKAFEEKKELIFSL
ncbi:MAG: hypothetical protein O9353_05865, partial [Bacteroidia bacterium]|nr:hypothetical protein [Bacteroidia bacterium]